MDFANVLFGGPCNRRCPYCIGELLPDRVNVDNRDVFPPAGIDRFVDEVNARGIREIVFTGTTTDPQLYRHEVPLLELLRSRISGARYSVHTNGAVALQKIDVFNRYDRACISLPSFDPEIYARHMGSRQVPDVARILERARIPVKISCVLDADNARDLERFLSRCRALGVRRVVLRRQFGDTRTWEVPLRQTGTYRGNPVYDHDGVEVTYWDFDATTSTSLNLFADGSLGEEYLLVRSASRAAV
ncbi:MAG: radical SAM protein [Deltaproteobacteria bacterium]|nr:radical SAM protein [Deltaproteobacteria bacterium]